MRLFSPGRAVDLLRISARVAGKPMLMMRDMGYDPKLLVYNADEALAEAARASVPKGERYDWEQVHRTVNEAILKAWADAGLPDPGRYVRERRMTDDPRNVIHELEHLILDPDFNLGEGKSSGHSGVESVLEEALSWGLGDGVEEEGRDIVGGDAPSYMFPDAGTVAEALDAIAKAPVSSAPRRAIRDSALREVRGLFNGVLDSDLDDGCGPEIAKAIRSRQGYPLRGAIGQAFVRAVESRYDDWKQVLTEEHEDAWRRFNLRLKAEMKRIDPGGSSKPPKDVLRERNVR